MSGCEQDARGACVHAATLSCVRELIAPQWRSMDYSRNDLLDELRAIVGSATDA